jgi:exoribonuclease R
MEPITCKINIWELNICDRNYEKWTFINKHDSQNVIHSLINPLLNKLFHKDVIDEFGNIHHSPYTKRDTIPGVLIINGNTYGHLNGDVKMKLLYKCIPDDKSLPIFLIPYEYKYNTFSKNKYNKYVTFRIKEWINKHPIASLTNTFGDVNDNEAFYQYQLCCKNLGTSISGFIKATTNALKLAEQLRFNLEDRRMYDIFSIDPPGSKDIDDAMGITTCGDVVIISIYIANVALTLDHLQLWDAFGKRVSTIYLPNGKLPMLPNILSDDLCSLVHSEDRSAYCMDICIDASHNIISITFKSVIVRVKQNYAYEEERLLEHSGYISILNITKSLNSNYKYVDTIVDSHHIVEFFMIMMNYEVSKILLERKSGIFRRTNITEVPTNQPLPKHMMALINNISGSYCTYENVNAHVLIGEGLASYVHITSPIRRLVDLCNLIELQQEYMSQPAKDFSKMWMASVDDINTTMKNIKRVQNNCNLLSLYSKEGPKTYTGTIFDRMTNTGDISKYSIYIPALNMVSTLKTRENLANYSTVLVSTHAFVNEDNIMKKIRLQLV